MMIRRIATPRTARTGFTLMELMVSVAILLAILAMVGTIFTTASKAGGNATAMTTVHRQLRQAAQMIRKDLEAMDPATDVLGIAGVAAQALNSPKRPGETGWHRADVLMVITQRRDTRTFAYQGFVNPATEFSDRMQVVYGHADTARFDLSTGLPIASTVKRIEAAPSAIPSYEWHLARRTVLFPSAIMGASLAGVYDGSLSADPFLFGQADLTRATKLTYDTFLPAGVFHYTSNGTLGECYVDRFLGTAYSFLYVVGAKPVWRLYHTGEGHWYTQDPAPEWVRNKDGTPANIMSGIAQPAVAGYQGPTYGLDKHFYNTTSSSGNRRTIIDSSPVRGQSVRMGPQFLPNCSDFRVEYTYDDPRDVNPTHNYGTTNLDPVTGLATTFARPIHWHTVMSGDQMVWSKITNAPTDRTLPYRWPTALRITLRCWDAGGRLNEPVTYTMIHTWPSGE